MIAILCDSATDVPAALMNRENIEIVPIRVILGENSYKDDLEIDEKTLLDYMEHSFAKTSLPSYEEVENGFLRLIEKGYDKIITINVSSGLSGTYNFFKLVSRDLTVKHPEIRIECFDTLSVSIGAGMYIYKAAQLIDEGLDMDDIIKRLTEYRNGKITGFFIIPTLKYLKAGGRIGKVTATIGDVLNLKPVISVGTDGVYYTVTKARGMRRALDRLIERVVAFAENKKIEVLTVCRSGEGIDTLASIEKILNEFKNVKIGEILSKKISSSMTVHAGGGLVGVAIMVS